jgi:UDP-N-acetylmuramoyl-tripeptide--D-alanyl-D-alanine ligase
LPIFWIIISIRMFLFYLYLWQIKEYQVKRFIDHFRTEKGKRLFINQTFFLKVFLLAGILFFSKNQSILSQRFFAPLVLWVTFVFFFALTLYTLLRIGQKEIKYPVFTKKMIILAATGLAAGIIILLFASFIANIYNFSFYLLLTNVLIPVIASLIVISLQPFAVLLKRNDIKRATAKRSGFANLKTVGITGSYGKTSTKEILATILSDKFDVLKTEKNQNSEAGISQCILRDLNGDHEVFVAEMGTYGVGGIKLLADIVQPQIGILTGINEQHLALQGSINNTIKAKYELIESLSKDGLAVFNGDNKHCLKLYEATNIPKKIYTLKKSDGGDSDIWAEGVKVEKRNLYFTVSTKEGENEDFRVNLLGEHNIPNVLAAVLVARHLGMSLKEISSACKKIRESQGAMQLLAGTRGLNILDASYSANPQGVFGDLQYLKIRPPKRIIIMPCLIELGKKSKEVHKEIGKRIGEVCDFAIVTTKERFSDIKEAAVESGMEEKDIILIEKTEEILRRLEIVAVPGDTVLLEGRVPVQLKEELIKEGINV